MKVAILHYWFLGTGGGEKVIEALAAIYPGADIFCLFADKRCLPHGISERQLKCSFLETLPLSHHMNRVLFPFYAAAAGSFDFSNYDLIVSSDSPPIKGIIPPLDAVHISYCHTPGRVIWDQASAFTATLPWFARPLFANLASRARVSDFVAAQRVDAFVANSHYVARRIRKYYCRKASVIYPPVNVMDGYVSSHHDDFYLSVGRLVNNKRIDLLIHACNQLGRKLIVVGEGRDAKALKAIAGPTVDFVGRISHMSLGDLYSRCRAFLFAADEDFGIVSVEAQAYGRPVIAYGHGGSLETVRVDDPSNNSDTGLFFFEQTTQSLVDAILRFEAQEHRFVASQIRQHALGFDVSVFKERMKEFVRCALKAREVQPSLHLPIQEHPLISASAREEARRKA